jgi:hypothetical protein
MTDLKPSWQRLNQSGTYEVRVALSGSATYPMRGGQGQYQPQMVLLIWTTGNGMVWTFDHAVISGYQIEARTGRLGQYGTAQTIHLGDPGYPECEPRWLVDLAAEMAPGHT